MLLWKREPKKQLDLLDVAKRLIGVTVESSGPGQGVDPADVAAWLRELFALRARVAELEEENKRLTVAAYAVTYWAAKAEAVRVAAEDVCANGGDPDAVDALAEVVTSCPPLESVTKEDR